MGLDMYLEARLHLPPYDDDLAAIRQAIGQAVGYTPSRKKPGDDPTLMEVTGVAVRVGHWHKLDPLHRWFVDRTRDGRDDGHPAFVSPATLVALEHQLDPVDDVPTSAGEHVLIEKDEALGEADVAYTRAVVAHAQRLQVRGWDIYYHAYW